MTTIVAKVKGIQVFESEDSASVRLTLDKEFEGYKADENGVYVKAMVNYVYFYRSALTAQLCDLDDDIAMMRCLNGKAFDQADFCRILFGADIKLELTEHLKGDVVEVNGEERTIDRDCMFVDAVGVKLTTKAKERIERKLEW